MEKKTEAFKSMQKKQKYGMIQIEEELHKELKEYCNHHGFKISGFVAALVRKSIKGK